MKRIFLIATVLAVFAALSYPLVQERVRKKGPADFASIHKSLGEAWEAKQYGRGIELARELMALFTEKRTEVIVAAMPAAPEGWTVQKREGNAEANPFAAAIVAGVGSVVEQTYRQTGGRGSMEVTVTADSPLAQMFQMWVGNPALLGPDAELVKYGQHNAVLKKEGNRWSLQILIDDDVVDVKLQGADDEFLLKVFDQKAVDRLAGALAS